MEAPVRAAETSEGRISLKKSSNDENKNVVAHFSGEKRCNEERKESDFKDRNSKSNEFSLERKMSFKELRKSVEEIEDEPNLTSRKQGQVSLVMACKDTLQHDQQKEVPLTKRKEERKQPEGNVKEEPATLHLSQIKIQRWTKVKQNDEEALSRLKQVCGALEGDDIYHYENIDDFDDTTENYQPKCGPFKRSRLLGSVKQHICCRYQFDKDGTISADVPCKGNFTEEYEKALRPYLVGEIARGAKTIQCLQKGCSNLYDPWEVVEVVANKAAQVWLENNTNDPLNRRHKNMALHSILRRDKCHVKKWKKKPSVLKKARESEPIAKENWWRRKSKTNKIKLFELLKTCDGRRVPVFGISVGKADNSATSEAKAHKVLNYKYKCTTCLKGFNEDPEPGGLTCGHYACRSCLHYYFKQQICNMITSIECPRRDCCQRFDTSFILDVLDNFPLRHTYMSLYNKRKVFDNEKERSKSDETCHQLKKQAASSSVENQEQVLTNPEVSKSLSNQADPWLNASEDYKRCPGCYAPKKKSEDDEACNIVLCSSCRTKFCMNCGKKCNEAFHLYKCPMFGSNKFSKKRRIANYFGYSTGFAVGVPVVGTLVIGTGVVALATLIAIGSLSPPVFLSRKMHKYHKLHNSSACRRRLAVAGGASLGALALPVLSAWGVYKTVITASKKTAKIVDHLLPPDDDGDLYPTLKAKSYGPKRDSTDDKNTAH